MIGYIVTAVIIIEIILNYVLGEVLYKEPSNEAFFNNVTNYNIGNGKVLMASPKYVFILSILMGLLVGGYYFIAGYTHVLGSVTWITILVLFIFYLTEITKKITLGDDKMRLECAFTKAKEIDINAIDGIYIYSLTKKFLNKRALTTKLVVVSGAKKTKFTISSLDIKPVIAMMKENFGINENKMYILKKR